MSELTDGGEKFERYMSSAPSRGGVVISGAGRFVEGQLLSVGGSARISRDLEVELLTVGGSLRAEGRVRAETARIGGSASLRSLEAKRLSVGGSISIEETLKVESGSLGGAIRAREIVAGTLSIGGAVRANKIEANSLRIRLSGDSEVGEVRAEVLRVRRERGAGGILGRLLAGRGVLRCHRIEAGSADVEYVECDEMVVEDARVGRECRIGRLVYSGRVDVDPRVEVGRVERRAPGGGGEGDGGGR